MAYLNFNKITPPAPNDPNVDEATQLNQNWDTLDAKLQPYINGGTITNIEVGQEIFNSNFDFGVWDGTTLIPPDDIAEGWSAWTNIPMATGRFVRSGFQPKWRSNSLLRVVELSGGVQYDSGASAWPLGVMHTLNADATGSPPSSFQPIGNLHYSPAATGLTTGTAVVAAAQIKVEVPSGNPYVRISGQYMGGPGGGNFIMLDQVWWWY